MRVLYEKRLRVKDNSRLCSVSKNLPETSHILLSVWLHEHDHRVASKIQYCASRGVSVQEARQHALNDGDIRVYSVHSQMSQIQEKQEFFGENHRDCFDLFSYILRR